MDSRSEVVNAKSLHNQKRERETKTRSFTGEQYVKYKYVSEKKPLSPEKNNRALEPRRDSRSISWGINRRRLRPRPRPSSTFRRQSVAVLNEAIAERLHRMQASPWQINPTSKFMETWDLTSMFALLFVAVVTPFEVAFLPDDFLLNTLFWVNRVIDLFFVADMIIQFFLMYEKPRDKGGGLERDQRKIIWKYLTTWFAIDLISIFPTDLIDQGGSDLTFLRIIRVLKLLKLMRVLRASRIMKRWESSISIRNSVLQILKMGSIMLVYTHWTACLWGLLPTLEPRNTATWVTRWVKKGLEEEVLQRDTNCPRESILNEHLDIGITTNGVFWEGCFIPAELYAVCLHWSVLTLTGIGYGDVVPVNMTEYLGCIALMLLGGTLWAYIIGALCAAAANLNPQETRFKQLMDDLNGYMRDHHIGETVRREMRLFYLNAKDGLSKENSRMVVHYLSPALAAKCMKEYSESFRKHVPYLRTCPESVIVSLVLVLKIRHFAPQEKMLEANEMYFLKKGLIARAGRVISKKTVLGYDFALDHDWLKELDYLIMLTYVELHSITRGAWEHLVSTQPRNQAKTVERWIIRFKLVRCVKYAANCTLVDGQEARVTSRSRSFKAIAAITKSPEKDKPVKKLLFDSRKPLLVQGVASARDYSNDLLNQSVTSLLPHQEKRVLFRVLAEIENRLGLVERKAKTV